MLSWHKSCAAALWTSSLGQDDIYEYYHPVTGENPPKAASIFGWSAAVYIDLAIQASRERR